MILVTGASGFLGRHLVRYLSEQRQQVRALYYNQKPGNDLLALPGTEWHRCDLLDIYALEELMADITSVYHCAAMVSFDPAMRDQMLHFNVESTANIVNLGLQSDIRKLIHVSSVAALGKPAIVNKELTEEEIWGESKYNSA